MNNQNIGMTNDRRKTIIVYCLYLGTLIIVFLGFFFSAYSVLNDINFQVLSASVPGIVFGMMVAYLGLRYLFMVSDFKTEFYKSNEKFSWSNFKKAKRRLVK